MKTYRIVWTIEIEAESPEQAAKEAREIQLDSESEATNFEVLDPNTNKLIQTVDLLTYII
jgi:hypothetical protein